MSVIFMPLAMLIGFGMYLKDGMRAGAFIIGGSIFIFTYSLIKLLINKRNKIYVTLDDKDLTVEWRPHNMVKDKSYSISDKEQVYVRTSPGGGYGLFLIVNGLEGSKHVEIIPRSTSPIKLRYLEQTLEKQLGITNKKVIGEMA